MAESGGPEFTVVIPSRDRPAQLERCLEALTRLVTPRERFEVVVVDDGSRVSYEEIVARRQRQINIRLLRREGGGPGLARNAGAAEARGRFIALTDDDCAPAPDWLEHLGETLRRQPEALAGGRTLNVLAQNVYSETSQELLAYLYGYYHGAQHDMRFFASCNFALSARLFQESGGFHARFRLAGGEDRDFCDRWTAAGRPTVYAGDAVVYHAHALTLVRFLRQHYTYGRGAWHFHQARAQRGRGGLKTEPLDFYTGMLTHPFRAEVRRPWTVSVLMGASVVMNAAGYFRERFGARPA